jgi:hypothetical protein
LNGLVQRLPTQAQQRNGAQPTGWIAATQTAMGYRRPATTARASAILARSIPTMTVSVIPVTLLPIIAPSNLYDLNIRAAAGAQ